MQSAGEEQSASDVHVFLQTFAPHWYGKQGVAPGVPHFPLPSQVEAAVNTPVPVGQLAATQVVPETYFWQAPLPSHFPSSPQDATPASLQVPCGSGAPTATLVQVPRVVGSAHD
jgi:hypothetical protein